MKRLTTFKELRERKILFYVTIKHLKIFIKELLRRKHIYRDYKGNAFTHLTLARGNFSQWIFPRY